MVRRGKLDMALVDSTDRDRSLHFRKLYQQDFVVALPENHPLTQRERIDPHEVVYEPQVAFNYDVSNSFKEWSTGAPTDESVLCTVDTAQAALDLVAAWGLPLYRSVAPKSAAVCAMSPWRIGTRRFICASCTTSGWNLRYGNL